MLSRLTALAATALLACACRTVAPVQEPATQTPAVPAITENPIPPVAAPSAETENSVSPTPLNPALFAAEASVTPSSEAETKEAPQTNTETQTAASPTEKPEETPAVPAVFPPDSPAFEDEEIIDVSGRLLNPYSYLTPDASGRAGAPWDGEQLKYGIYYTFVKAGTAYIKNRGLVDIDGRKAYLLQTTAFSASVIDPFFKVRDINQSWIDAETFYSLGYTQSVREGNYKRDEWLIFAPQEGKYFGQVQKKEEPRDISAALTQDVADFLSSLYLVRAQPLTPGKDIVFDIINREKQYPLVVKVLNKEKVSTPAGTFKCIVVEPQLRGEGIFVSKGKSLKVWLTDDAYRMPVKMKVEVFIGSVSAQLLEYKRN